MTSSLPSVHQVADMAHGPARERSIIGALMVGAIVGLAVVRELVTPELPLAGASIDVLGGRTPQPLLWRPISLVVVLLCDVVALSALARALDRRGWRAVWHVAATAGLSIALITAYALSLKLALHAASPSRAFVTGPIGGLQIYALWLLVFRYPGVVRNARVRTLEAERLQRAAELAQLHEHLQPHFLRNTLNAIAASVHDDPDQARDLLGALGDLLSGSLAHGGAMQALRDETAWLRRYSEIFEARFRGALRFAWDLDPAAAGVELPRLLLQPLVENAIRHGALARPDGGEVVVQTRRTATGAVIVVSDDGPGLDPRRPEGLGLRLVRRRLAIECGDAELHLESSAAGTRAIVELR